jgi:1-deoxy-D-xylulose-5-phosphate synthase
MEDALTPGLAFPVSRPTGETTEAAGSDPRIDPLLPRINSPQDLQPLKVEQLQQLAAEIREYVVSVVSKVGGHLGPSLGVVELTLALHKTFDSPKDKIIWDVGHQAYPHKILTGRRDRFPTLRQYGGITGFVNPAESPHDAFGVAHASTSIAAALGMAAARDLKGERHHVVTVTGDGAMTGGLAYEALNNAGHSGRDLLVILNDNEMSISPNVGAISHYLTSITANPFYNRIKEEVKGILDRLPLGEPVGELAKRVEHNLKNILVPGALFQALGFHYYGPIDGHNLPELLAVLGRLKNAKGPVLLHVLTRKGKGYAPAEGDACYYHGVAPFDATTGKTNGSGGKGLPSYNEVFAESLSEISVRDSRVVAISAAMADGTGLVGYRQRFPGRFFDVGIAEAHAVCFAAGLATQGIRPVAAIYSTFLQRAYDQIVHDVGIQNLPVVFCLDRAGLVGPDGPTHHGVFDLSYLRAVPNFIVTAPKDGDEMKDLLTTALEQSEHPFAIRYPKTSCVRWTTGRPGTVLPIGSWEELRTGRGICLLAVGTMVEACGRAVDLLREQGVQAGLVNCRFVKPLDREMLRRLRAEHDLLVTVEENVLAGGFGAAVHEALAEMGRGARGLAHCAVPDRFIAHGSRAELLEEVGLTPSRIAARVLHLAGERA